MSTLCLLHFLIAMPLLSTDTMQLSFVSLSCFRAFAKAGKRVLHLDHASNYGSAWASLQLDDLLQFTARCGDGYLAPSRSTNECDGHGGVNAEQSNKPGRQCSILGNFL
jgi:hypothetical protein